MCGPFITGVDFRSVFYKARMLEVLTPGLKVNMAGSEPLNKEAYPPIIEASGVVRYGG